MGSGGLGGGTIALSLDGTAKHGAVYKGTWRLEGNRLMLKLKTNSGASGFDFDGVLAKNVELSAGRRKVTFTGTKKHWGGSYPRSIKGDMSLYPDG